MERKQRESWSIKIKIYSYLRMKLGEYSRSKKRKIINNHTVNTVYLTLDGTPGARK